MPKLINDSKNEKVKKISEFLEFIEFKSFMGIPQHDIRQQNLGME